MLRTNSLGRWFWVALGFDAYASMLFESYASNNGRLSMNGRRPIVFVHLQ